jgi:hypothetical protein
MDGVIEIKIPEIKGLEDVFAKRTAYCDPAGATMHPE